MSRKLNRFLIVLAAIAVQSESRGAEVGRRVRSEVDPQTCAEEFDLQRDKIIRTEESRAMGARYISELDTGSREECLRLCCETDACDVFVFEEKSPGSCYLFTCGPPEDFKCKFTRHNNFSSGVLGVSRRVAETELSVRLSKHEHDLASLRNPPVSTARVPKLTVPTTTSTTTTAPPLRQPNTTQHRCSPYQFECHGSGECIAIYNACDGVPQCADGSDEAPELGCPSAAPAPPPARPPPPPPPPPQPPLQKVYGAEAVSPFLRELGSEYGPSGWPHRLTQAQQQSGNEVSSHIFNHKGSLLQEGENSPPQQYVPVESMQENQWVRRPWQQQIPMEQMPMGDRQLMYRYEQGWKPAAPRPEARPPPERAWPPQRGAPPNQEPPIYSGASGMSMPEASYVYSNQDSTLRDSPKKGFDLSKKEHAYAVKPAYTEEKSNTVEKSQEKLPSEVAKVATVEKDKSSDAKSAVKASDAVAKVTEGKHAPKHEHYTAQDDDHDGLSEKPAGAILLLIMGILMTAVMAGMLGCRLRLARRSMRRAGKSPFAHDADYLVNGMYL